MSEPDDADLNVLKAALPSREVNVVEQLRFQLLGFAAALAVLVTLAPTWMVVRDGTVVTSVHSGLGMIRDNYSMNAVGTYLFIAYIILALVALLGPTTIAAVISSYAGLVVTAVIMLLRPDSFGTVKVGWTGAPAVALGLWLVLVAVAHAGWFDTRRRN